MGSYDYVFSNVILEIGTRHGLACLTTVAGSAPTWKRNHQVWLALGQHLQVTDLAGGPAMLLPICRERFDRNATFSRPLPRQTICAGRRSVN